MQSYMPISINWVFRIKVLHCNCLYICCYNSQCKPPMLLLCCLVPSILISYQISQLGLAYKRNISQRTNKFIYYVHVLSKRKIYLQWLCCVHNSINWLFFHITLFILCRKTRKYMHEVFKKHSRNNFKLNISVSCLYIFIYAMKNSNKFISLLHRIFCYLTRIIQFIFLRWLFSDHDKM